METANALDIRTVSTVELVEELRRREGVEEVFVPPYESFEVAVGGKKTSGSGPATVLTVID